MNAGSLRGQDLVRAGGVAFTITAVRAVADFVLEIGRRETIRAAGYHQSSVLLQKAGGEMEPRLWEAGDWRYWLFLVLLALTARWAAAGRDLGRPLAVAAALAFVTALHSGGTVGDMYVTRWVFYAAAGATVLVGQRYDVFGKLVALPMFTALVLTVIGDQTLFDASVKSIAVEAPHSYTLRLLDLVSNVAFLYATVACHAWALAQGPKNDGPGLADLAPRLPSTAGARSSIDDDPPTAP
jgi:hypothetical protein